MKKYCINIDWLELYLNNFWLDQENESNDIKINENLIFENIGYGNKNFKYGFNVYLHGEKFATAFISPRSEILESGSWTMKIENYKLYESEIFNSITEICTAINCNVKNVSRLDIALDGFGFMETMEKAQKGEIFRKGQAKENIYRAPQYTEEKIKRGEYRRTRPITGFDIGSRKSDKYITGYVKTDRILKENKTYIRKVWQKAGLSPHKVERLEVKLNSKYLSKLKIYSRENRLEEFNYDMLKEERNLIAIFKEAIKNNFDFVYNNKSRVEDCTEVQIIDWSKINSARLEKSKAPEPNFIYGMKQTAKNLFKLYLKTSAEYYYKQSIEIAMNYDFLDWLQEKISHWRSEHIKYMTGSNGNYKKTYVHYLGDQLNISNDITDQEKRKAKELVHTKQN